MNLEITAYILVARSKMFFFKSLLISLLFVYVTANNAHSQQLTGIIADSLGGAGAVAAEATEGHLINPATLPHSKSMTVGAFYRAGDLTSEIDENTYSIGVVDNTDGVFLPGGFSYAKTSRKLVGFDSIKEEFIQLSVGQFVGNQLSLGGSLLTLSQKVAGDQDYRQWDASLGVMWNPAPNYALGLSYLYFAEAPDETPAALVLPSTWVLGGSYILTQYARFRLDITRPKQPTGDTKLVYKFGLESFINEFSVLRLGYQQDENSDLDSFSLGLSFIGPRFELSYGFKKLTSGGSSGVHGIDFRVPL